MFGSTNAFGQPLGNPFGSQSGFGQPGSSKTPFGSQSGGSLLGGSSTDIFESTSLSLGSTPAFGASPAPAFGSAMPPFGEPCTPSSSFGGSSVFGQKPAFGGFVSFQDQRSPFGSTFQQTQSAFGSNHFGSTQFGASSQPAFSSSSQPAFGSESTPAFGSTTTPAFGATTTPAFGATATPAFGSTTTALFGSTGEGFGVSSTPTFSSLSQPAFGSASTPAFGCTTTPAFGATTTPAFGATATQAFGSTTSLFGSTGARFRVSSTPAFGSSAAPAFGAPSTSFFGSLSTPAFGVSSSPAFGSSAPAFGSPTTPSFGFGSSPSFAQSTPKFSSTPFGSTPSPFGTQSSPFGVQTTMPSFDSKGFGQSVLGGQDGGSRVVAYAPTPDTDGSSGMQTGGKLESVSAMYVYTDKNHEELRWVDYQRGDKGGPDAARQPANGTSFPAQTQPNPFSSTGTFSQFTTNPFSSPSSNPFAPKPTPFGSSTIGSSSTSLFSSPFNSSSSSPFGTTSTIQVFDAPSNTGFTFTFSISLFAPKTTPFGSSTTGSSSTSLFSSPFNSSSSSPFGTTSTTQVFGAPSNIGFTFASSPSFFGGTTNVAPSEPLFLSLSFGNTQSSRLFQSLTPSIVQTPSIFGQLATEFQQSTTGFGCPFGTTSTTQVFGAPSNTGFTFASTPSFFGGTTNVASSEPFHSLSFGNTQSSRLFQSSTPSIVQTPSIFGQSATGFQQSTTGFGLNLFGAPATGFGGSQFGSMPSISTTSNPADVDQAIPSIPNAFQMPAPTQTSNAFNLSNFGQTQSAFSGGFGSTSDIFNQGSFLQSRDSTPSYIVPITNPFGTLRAMPQMSIGRAETTPPIDSIQYGISSMRVVDEQTSPVRISSLLAPQYLSQRKSDGQRVSFFTDDEEVPATTNANALFFPRENPRELINFVGFTKCRAGKMSEDPSARAFHEPLADHCESSTSDGQKESTPSQSEPAQKAASGAHNDNTRKGTEDSSCITMSGHQAGEEAIVYEHGAGIEALMPKLRHTDYYTEPRVQELAAMEQACPGFCRRVKDFVVGRKGFGSIKFYGETDVRMLDLEAIVQFNNQEVVVYKDESEKPALGQGLNKPAEVTLLNVMCVNKKTGQRYIEGARVEKYKETLAKKAKEHGGELVLYDPVKGEWKFKVKQFIGYE